MLADDRRGDQELWESAVSGEADAFGSLFERHHLVIYNFCFRRSASWSTAEDLMSVVFLEAWRTRRHMVLSGGSLLPWLFAIATRVTSHTHRSRLRHRKALARVASRRTETPDHADAVVDRLADEQRMQGLLDALAALPRGERDVLELSAFADLDYAGIGLALGIPIGTVRSRLSRARARLRLAAGTADSHDDQIKEALR